MNYSFAEDSFDSKIFGFKVAKISSIDDSGSPQDLEENVNELLSDLKKNEFVYATYRIEANKFPLIHALEVKGFMLVDGLISLELKTSDAAEEDSIEIREAKDGDKKSLEELASSSFFLNRVFNDPFIPKDKARDFYKTWLDNSLSGEAADLVLVYGKEEIEGFTTLQKKGHIPLTAVSEKSRGKGIAKKLTKATFPYFKKWGASEILIETQMGNVPALRAYQSCGFKIINSHLTFRWVNSD